jgi:NAD(P)H dehydrogenase (quinone)
MGQSNADEQAPSAGDIETAERLGHRVALICRRFREGTAFETERLAEPEFRKLNIERRKGS